MFTLFNWTYSFYSFYYALWKLKSAVCLLAVGSLVDCGVFAVVLFWGLSNSPFNTAEKQTALIPNNATATVSTTGTAKPIDVTFFSPERVILTTFFQLFVRAKINYFIPVKI